MRSPDTLDYPRYRLLVAALVAILLVIPFTPARVLGVFLAAGVIPGLAIASRARFLLGESLGVGTALAPVVFGGVALASMRLGTHVDAAAWIAAGVGLVLFVAAWGKAAPPTRETIQADQDDRRALTRVLVVAGLAAVMAFTLPLTDLWWRGREDSWFHAAVADKLARDGLPLTDPYFAGMRLQYMYFYHAIVAGCASLAHIDALHAMILVNAIALLSCALAFHALSGMFSRRRGPRVLGLCVWLFAMNGWFYLFYPLRVARALTGQTHGLAVLKSFFPWTPNGHATAMSLISVEGNQFMFLDKFMLGTAFSLTFSLGATLLFLLLCARRGRWSRRHDLALSVCVAGAMLLHPVTGITFAGVTACVLLVLLALRARRPTGGPSYARLLGWVVLAAAVTVPYLRSFMPRGAGEGAPIRFALQPGVALGLFADILPALAFTAFFFRRGGAHPDTAERAGARLFSDSTPSAAGILALWTLLALGVALTVDLTTNNETKFAFVVLLPLAAFAVGAFERAWDAPRVRVRALAALATATVPLHLLYFHHAVRDPSSLGVSREEEAVYRWIVRSTPRDAVFLEAGDNVRVPVLASRDLYWGTPAYAHNWGYPAAEMDARRRVRDAVFSPEGLSADDVAQLRALGRPVFVVSRKQTAPDGGSKGAGVRKGKSKKRSGPRFEDSNRFRGRFATAGIAVWEVVLE